MKLIPLDRTCIEIAAEWLGKKENYQWLDFGSGVQQLSPLSLHVMAQRDIHFLRAFTCEPEDRPIGMVGLSNIARGFRTATLWYLLGDKTFAGQGHTTKAVKDMLHIGFGELSLEAINAWVVDTNVASRRILEKNGFRYVGRQRRCHYLDGHSFDRLLFDLLKSELLR